jgi:phage tail sheath protein FI
MSVLTPYPGVYVQEIPSGVRTIAGVATSITAFVGRTRRGPVDRATTVHNYADFERAFGGVWRASPVSFAVRDFFANGGGQAVIVRLARDAGTAQFTLGDLGLAAADPGAWANTLRVQVAHVDDAELETQFDVPAGSLFNLTVVDTVTGEQETFRNLTVVDGPRRVDRVLAAESQLVRTRDALPGDRPAVVAAPGTAPDGDGGTDGEALTDASYTGAGLEAAHRGLWALDQTDLFNLLCIPPPTVDGTTSASVYQTALGYCERRRAVLIVDPPAGWGTVNDAVTGLDALGLTGLRARNAALYFPRIRQPDPTAQGRLDTFVACGALAGVMSRTDGSRGVWKAPAGIDASLAGVSDLAVNLTDDENGMLNPLGINCLRSFPVVGRVVWGARTLRGADRLADEYRYLPVRRLALNIEESLFRGTQWVVFEPNDTPLWAQIRLNVGAFMQNLFRQGAFQGATPNEAYFVRCGPETTTQHDINLGRVNILVGFAPLRPAEFVILQIQQITQANA